MNEHEQLRAVNQSDRFASGKFLGVAGEFPRRDDDGFVGVFGGHTDFTDPRRFWDFRSLGHGDINFEEIIVALNDVNYTGPLSVEWEDIRMDREHGAAESCAFLRKLDFARSAIAFDAAFDKENQ